MTNRVTPKQFLQIGGVVLLLLGVVGFLVPNLLGDTLKFDTYENVAHTLLGAVALYGSAKLSAQLQLRLTQVVGVLALVVGVLGFMNAGNPEPNFYGANLENPVDNVLHLVVGAWGAWVGFAGKMTSAPEKEEGSDTTPAKTE